MGLTEFDLTHASGIESDERTVEVTLDEIRNLISERAFTGETVLLNMGPHHPSTHGVLRLLLELDGETVVNVIPDIGYLHTAFTRDRVRPTGSTWWRGVCPGRRPV